MQKNILRLVVVVSCFLGLPPNLVVAAHLRGWVFDEDGNAVLEAHVWLFHNGVRIDTRHTDENGRFEKFELPKGGTYTLWIFLNEKGQARLTQLGGGKDIEVSVVLLSSPLASNRPAASSMRTLEWLQNTHELAMQARLFEGDTPDELRGYLQSMKLYDDVRIIGVQASAKGSDKPKWLKPFDTSIVATAQMAKASLEYQIPPPPGLDKVGNVVKHASDKKHLVTIDGKYSKVAIPPGGSKLVQLTVATKELSFLLGDNKKSIANDKSFDWVRCERSADTGDCTWTFFRMGDAKKK